MVTNMGTIRESVEGSNLDRIHAAITETIAARHLTFEMSDSPLVPTEEEPTSRATGYVDLGEKVIDAHIRTIFPAAGLDENSPPAASKASGTTLYVELDSEAKTWGSMAYSGLGESLVAVLYWLRSVTTAVPTARAGDYAVDMDFRNIVTDPGVDVRPGIEAAGLVGTVLQAQVHLDEQGLIANIAMVLPERILPDGLRVDSRVLALSLARSGPRAVVLPANASGTSVEELTDRLIED
jgi:hypothetical protein